MKTPGISIPDSSRRIHYGVFGGSGSGKSELEKVLIRENLLRRETFMLLDPHGDLASEVKQLKMPGHRAVYICPEIKVNGKTFVPRFNPFEIDYECFLHMEREHVIPIRRAELLSAFKTIFRAEFTPNMQLMLSMCFQVLLERIGSYFGDLIMLLQPVPPKELLELGTDHLDPTISGYFQHMFMDKSKLLAKQAILTRFLNAFTNPYLKNMLLCRKSTFNLMRLLMDNTSVIINASQAYLGEAGTKIFGALLMADYTSFALSREFIPKKDRHPIYCYIDECHIFLNENIDKILSEARKYGTFLVLANQYLGQYSKANLTGLLESVLANTGVKFVGKLGYKDRLRLSKEIGRDLENDPPLHTGKFALKVDKYDAVLMQATDELIRPELRSKYYISGAEEAKFMKKQANTFYHYPATSDFDLEMQAGRSSETPKDHTSKQQSSSFDQNEDEFDSIF